jgi:signal transduction histidine kinase
MKKNKMAKIRHKLPFSLQKDFLRFAACMIAVIGIFSSFVLIRVYATYNNTLNYRFSTETARIGLVISEAFDYTQTLMTHIGYRIKSKPIEDLQYISDVFRNNENINSETMRLFPWSIFDWINKDNLQTVNSKIGVLDRPIDMSTRKYIMPSRLHPWSLQLSTPTLGTPSGLWIIPVGMGITTDNGHFLGTIAVGFVIDKLLLKIEQAMGNREVSFAVLDDKGHVIMQSPDSLLDSDKPIFEQAEHVPPIPKIGHGALKKPFTASGIEFGYYRNLNNYPYTVLAGTNTQLASKNKSFLAEAAPHLLEILGLGLFCLTILYYFRMRLVRPIISLAKAAKNIALGREHVYIPKSDIAEIRLLEHALRKADAYRKKDAKQHVKLEAYAKELEKKTAELEYAKQEAECYIKMANQSDGIRGKFARNVYHEMIKPIHRILRMTEKLISYEEAGSNISRTEMIDSLHEIRQNALHFNSLSTDSLHLTHVNVEEALEECISIHKKTAYLNNILLEGRFASDIPDIYVDGLKFRQAIVGILTRIIDFSPPKTAIILEACVKSDNNGRFLVMTISDDGFGIDKNERLRIAVLLAERRLHRFLADGTGATPETIEKILKLHGGTIIYKDKLGTGSLITITLPYRAIHIIEPDNNSTNIVSLFKKD